MEMQANEQSDRRWQRVQAASGLGFAVFLIAHLGNTLFALVGANAYNGVQGMLRTVYQFPAIEILLLGLVLPAHMTAGIARARLRRRSARGSTSPAIRRHRVAGWFLLVVIYAHVAAVRLPALVFDTPLGFSGVSFTLHWLPAWFYPYYFALALAGFYHLFVGSRLALSRCGFRVRPPTALMAASAAAFGSVAFAFALLAFGGVVIDVADPFATDYARIVLDLVNRNLP